MAEKEAIRERVWDELDDSGKARVPFPPQGEDILVRSSRVGTWRSRRCESESGTS